LFFLSVSFVFFYSKNVRSSGYVCRNRVVVAAVAAPT
jgi:hypothetical protein